MQRANDCNSRDDFAGCLEIDGDDLLRALVEDQQ